MFPSVTATRYASECNLSHQLKMWDCNYHIKRVSLCLGELRAKDTRDICIASLLDFISSQMQWSRQQALNMPPGWAGRPPSRFWNCRSWTWGEKTPRGHFFLAHSWCHRDRCGDPYSSPWVWTRCTLYSWGWPLTLKYRILPSELVLQLYK